MRFLGRCVVGPFRRRRFPQLPRWLGTTLQQLTAVARPGPPADKRGAARLIVELWLRDVLCVSRSGSVKAGTEHRGNEEALGVQVVSLSDWRIGDVLSPRWKKADFEADMVRLKAGTTKNHDGARSRSLPSRNWRPFCASRRPLRSAAQAACAWRLGNALAELPPRAGTA